MKYLTKEEIIEVHDKFVDMYGIDSTILQPSNIDIAIEAPKRIVFGFNVFPTTTEKAAALLWNILKLHPFVDGNNRTGLASTSIFLEKNGREFTSSTEDEVTACRTTSACTWDMDEVHEWLQNNSRRKRDD